jgi:hypothetical protein
MVAFVGVNHLTVIFLTFTSSNNVHAEAVVIGVWAIDATIDPVLGCNTTSKWPRYGGGGCDCVGRHDGERSAVVYSRVGVGFLVWWCLEYSARDRLTTFNGLFSVWRKRVRGGDEDFYTRTME